MGDIGYGLIQFAGRVSKIATHGNKSLFSHNIVQVSLQSNVKSIEDNAFAESNITTITVPDSVTSLGNGVFQNCHALTSATLGSGCTYVSDNAFRYCENLQEVIMPTVTSILNNAFEQCEMLSKIDLLSVNIIQKEAFYECYSLSGLQLNCFFIGDNAFDSCTGAQWVILGSNLINIGKQAFFGTQGLTQPFLYMDTSTKWAGISKGTEWADGSAATTVLCIGDNVVVPV